MTLPKANLWIDDERPAPEGWVHLKDAATAICWLAINLDRTEHISFDHDLGPPEAGTGYDIVCWLEEQVMTNLTITDVPRLSVHSANPVGRGRMEAAINNIERAMMYRDQEGVDHEEC